MHTITIGRGQDNSLDISVVNNTYNLSRNDRSRRWELKRSAQEGTGGKVLYDSWPALWEENVAVGMALHFVLARTQDVVLE